jgi:hypothetical protein
MLDKLSRSFKKKANRLISKIKSIDDGLGRIQRNNNNDNK